MSLVHSFLWAMLLFAPTITTVQAEDEFGGGSGGCYYGDSGGGSGGGGYYGEVVVLPPFVVDGNDPATFDWDGYLQYEQRQQVEQLQRENAAALALQAALAANQLQQMQEQQCSIMIQNSQNPPVITRVPAAEGDTSHAGVGAIQINRVLSSSVPGVWVQKITITSNVRNPDGTPASSLTGGTSGVRTFVFYEGFATNATSVQADTFKCPEWPKGVTGTYTISGEAQFLPGAAMSDLSTLHASDAPGHVATSGFAPSGTTEPQQFTGANSVDITLTVTMTGESNNAKYSVTP
jgi:hypothetical protein